MGVWKNGTNVSGRNVYKNISNKVDQFILLQPNQIKIHIYFVHEKNHNAYLINGTHSKTKIKNDLYVIVFLHLSKKQKKNLGIYKYIKKEYVENTK